MNMEKKIVFASHNADKAREVKEMLSPLGIEVLTLTDVHLKQTMEETAETFEGNSRIKAEDIANQCDYAVLSDDSGLAIEPLGGFPGVHSARFMEGHPYEEKNREILKRMNGMEERKAAFITAMTYISEDRKVEKTFIGKDEGEIVKTMPEGKQNGFGYDPIFYSYSLKKTYGDALEEEKNSVSHRGKALRQVVEYLRSENDGTDTRNR